jgi:hypothetical protein
MVSFRPLVRTPDAGDPAACENRARFADQPLHLPVVLPVDDGVAVAHLRVRVRVVGAGAPPAALVLIAVGRGPR